MVKSKGWVGHHPATGEGEDQAGERERTLVVKGRYPYTVSMASTRRWKPLALRSATRRSLLTVGREALMGLVRRSPWRPVQRGRPIWPQL